MELAMVRGRLSGLAKVDLEPKIKNFCFITVWKESWMRTRFLFQIDSWKGK